MHNVRNRVLSAEVFLGSFMTVSTPLITSVLLQDAFPGYQLQHLNDNREAKLIGKSM